MMLGDTKTSLVREIFFDHYTSGLIGYFCRPRTEILIFNNKSVFVPFIGILVVNTRHWSQTNLPRLTKSILVMLQTCLFRFVLGLASVV